MNTGDRGELLSRWIKPSSDAEQVRQERAERMVREAINGHAAFREASVAVYAKGSYANNTNVRLDSDVDIVVECQDCMFYDYAEGVPRTSLSEYSGRWTTASWRHEVTSALVEHFGRSEVDTTGSIAVRISEKPGSRPSADVVPSFQYRLYWTADRSRYDDGSTVFTRYGAKIVNWPTQQLKNGRRKNDETSRRYKNYVRALKNAENLLSNSGVITAKASYLMECLVWNVPNHVLAAGALDDGFGGTLEWLWRHLNEVFVREEWLEPNGIKYAFGPHQKWTTEDAQQVVRETRRLLGY